MLGVSPRSHSAPSHECESELESDSASDGENERESESESVNHAIQTGCLPSWGSCRPMVNLCRRLNRKIYLNPFSKERKPLLVQITWPRALTSKRRCSSPPVSGTNVGTGGRAGSTANTRGSGWRGNLQGFGDFEKERAIVGWLSSNSKYISPFKQKTPFLR